MRRKGKKTGGGGQGERERGEEGHEHSDYTPLSHTKCDSLRTQTLAPASLDLIGQCYGPWRREHVTTQTTESRRAAHPSYFSSLASNPRYLNHLQITDHVIR